MKRLAACAAAALMAMSMALPASAATHNADLTKSYNVWPNAATIRYFYEPGTTAWFDDVVGETHCSSVSNDYRTNLAKVTVYAGSTSASEENDWADLAGDMKSGYAVVASHDYAYKVVHEARRNNGKYYTDIYV